MSNVGDFIAQHADELRAVIGAEPDLTEMMRSDRSGLRRLGSSFRLLPEIPSHSRFEFSPFLAETLLRDGSALIDRCLQTRREYHELVAKWFEVRVQVEEMLRLNEITSEEERLYDVPVHLDDGYADAEDKSREGLAGAKQSSTDSYNLCMQQHDSIINAAKASAWAQVRHTHGDAHYGYPPWNISDVPVRDHAYESAKQSMSHTLEVEKRAAESRMREQSGAAASAEKRRDVLRDSAKYKSAQAGLQRKRNDVARYVAARRALALAAPNGELNYREQGLAAAQRFEQDLNAAYVRLLAASKGLDLLYAYTEKFPLATNGHVDFDALVLWCQTTNLWLASFQDGQQIVTRSFSLRELVGRENFNHGKNALSWTFRLTRGHFYDRRLVRVRSLAARIIVDGESRAWNVAFRLPDRGELWRLDDTSRIIDQSHVGTIYLGRVTNGADRVLSEGAAPQRLQNASPIGAAPSLDWTVSSVGAPAGINKEKIEDLEIHITVALL